MKAMMAMVMLFASGWLMAESAAPCQASEEIPQLVQKPFQAKGVSGAQEIYITCGSSEAIAQPSSPACCERTMKEGDIAAPEKQSTWVRILEAVLMLLAEAAWPLSALAIALLYRKDIEKLLSRLKSGKVGSTEWVFDQMLESIEVDEVIGSGSPAEPISSEEATRASSNPRGAIIASWVEVESALKYVVEKKNLISSKYERPRSLPPASAIREVQRAELVDPRYISLFQELRVMRNAAAHSVDFETSTESALRYAALAKELSVALRNAADG